MMNEPLIAWIRSPLAERKVNKFGKYDIIIQLFKKV